MSLRCARADCSAGLVHWSESCQAPDIQPPAASPSWESQRPESCKSCSFKSYWYGKSQSQNVQWNTHVMCLHRSHQIISNKFKDPRQCVEARAVRALQKHRHKLTCRILESRPYGSHPWQPRTAASQHCQHASADKEQSRFRLSAAYTEHRAGTTDCESKLHFARSARRLSGGMGMIQSIPEDCSRKDTQCPNLQMRLNHPSMKL